LFTGDFTSAAAATAAVLPPKFFAAYSCAFFWAAVTEGEGAFGEDFFSTIAALLMLAVLDLLRPRATGACSSSSEDSSLITGVPVSPFICLLDAERAGGGLLERVAGDDFLADFVLVVLFFAAGDLLAPRESAFLLLPTGGLFSLLPKFLAAYSFALCCCSASVLPRTGDLLRPLGDLDADDDRLGPIPLENDLTKFENHLYE
jgi:hypothetical protein